MDGPGSGNSGRVVAEQFLSHFGVKGMKWGVRSSKKPAIPSSEDSTRVSAIRDKARRGGTKTLSNRDLQEAINRMNLERQFKTLSPTKTQAAAKFVSDILLNVGKQQAIRVAGDFATTKVNTALKK